MKRIRPINVVFVIDQLTETLGGGERALSRIISLLPNERFRCSLATFHLSPNLQVEHYFPCSVRVFPLKSVFHWKGIAVGLDFRRFLLETNAEIVHTFFESSDLYAGLVTKACTSAKLIWSRRDMGILRSAKHNLAYRITSSLPDLTLAVSERVREFAIAHDGLRPDKTLTHYNGIDVPELFSPAALLASRSRFNIPLKVPVITTLANIRRVKGIDTVVRVAAKVREVWPEALFLIVGASLDPPYLKEVDALAASLGVTNNMRFLGEQEDVNSILQMSDIGLLLSRNEGFSNALLESMAACLPCIASNVGGNAEALENGITGFLVDKEDSNAAAEHVIYLLQNKSCAQRLGAAARQRVMERFSTLKMISDLERFYESVLK